MKKVICLEDYRHSILLELNSDNLYEPANENAKICLHEYLTSLSCSGVVESYKIRETFNGREYPPSITVFINGRMERITRNYFIVGDTNEKS